MREIDELTLEQLCGQLLVVGFPGEELPDSIVAGLRQKQLAGVVLFSRNVPSWRNAWMLARRVVALSQRGFPPFVAIDQEGGRVQRIREGVLQLPALRVWTNGAQEQWCRRVAHQQASELAALGINLNFAPVADVDSNPDNPVIGDRAASDDPARVTAVCRALLLGQQDAGVMACLKHFPGHGATEVDSHHGLPTVDKSTIQLRTTELYPFERLCRQAAATMSAHVVFPVFDTVPATLSPRLCTTILRREFGFEGVLFSDDMEMGALSQQWSIEQSSVLAVKAGCDALLICHSEEVQQRALRALIAEARHDSAFKARVQEAVERGIQVRRKFIPRPAEDVAEIEALFDSQEHRELAVALESAGRTSA